MSKGIYKRKIKPIPPSVKGKHWKLSEETKKKMREAIKKRLRNGEKLGFQKGHIPNNPSGPDAHNWRGGKSFEPYGLEFNEDLKEVIRNRDRRKCFLCENTELDNKERLTVHHIDYDKQNNNPNNLISLCRKCHGKTNGNREYWENFFYEKDINTKHRCFFSELGTVSEEGKEGSNQ